LSAQAMETARAKDTGTLQYEIYFRDDRSECIVLERYRDSEALAEYAANLGELGQAILCDGIGLQRTPWRAGRRAQSGAG
jgi:hypothetical protein